MWRFSCLNTSRSSGAIDALWMWEWISIAGKSIVLNPTLFCLRSATPGAAAGDGTKQAGASASVSFFPSPKPVSTFRSHLWNIQISCLKYRSVYSGRECSGPPLGLFDLLDILAYWFNISNPLSQSSRCARIAISHPTLWFKSKTKKKNTLADHGIWGITHFYYMFFVWKSSRHDSCIGFLF